MSQTMNHFEQIWMPRLTQVKPTNTARSHGKKFKVTVKKKTTRILGNFGWAYMQLRDYTAAKDVCSKEWNNLFKAKIQVGFRGEASVGDAYNQIWFVKPEEKMKLLKKTRKIKDRKETLYVAGSNISRSQHSKETSLKTSRRSASHELPLLKALQSVAKKHKRCHSREKPKTGSRNRLVEIIKSFAWHRDASFSYLCFKRDEENGGGNEKLRRYFNKVVGCLDGKMIWPYQGFLQHCFSFRAKTRKLQKCLRKQKNLFKAKVRLWLEMLIKKCGMKKAVKSVKPKETYETPEKHERSRNVRRSIYAAGSNINRSQHSKETSSKWKIFWMRTTMGLYGCRVVWP
ncbi:hypothetical protein ISN44_As11g022000 [Arabidopsis suecica]|uniref:Uncharacterized protein n=1 Tax=Arabidopsis suecica TaxID=45249 RepID=A0A8T1ZAU1_ARASU|nr:hypothetical protein ISN44_As11g022000 [Arabidopsis suecica]